MGVERLIQLSALASNLVTFAAPGRRATKQAALATGGALFGGFTGAGYGSIAGTVAGHKDRKRMIERMKLDQVDSAAELKDYPDIKQLKKPEDVPESLGWRRPMIQQEVIHAAEGKNAFALPGNKKHGDMVGFPARANRSVIQHEIGHIRDHRVHKIKAIDHGLIGDLRGTTLKREKAAWDYVEKPDEEIKSAGLATYKKRQTGTRVGAAIGAAVGTGAGLLAHHRLTHLQALADNLVEFGYGDSILNKMSRRLGRIAKREGTSLGTQKRDTLRLRIAAASHVKAARKLAPKGQIGTADAIKVTAGLGLKTHLDPRAIASANKTLEKLGIRKLTMRDAAAADVQMRKKAFKDFSARIDALIEFRGGVGLGAGRNHNPLYDPSASDRARRPHRIGEGVERSVPLSKIISPQATIHGRKVRSMKDKIRRGQDIARKTLPTVQRSGSKFIVHDGNHGLAAALRAGKRTARVLVQ